MKMLCKELAKQINVDHIDVVAQPIYHLNFLKNTQYGYDLRYASCLIYGNKEILNRLPTFVHISPKSIEALLLSRIWCFLGPIKKTLFNGYMNRDELFFTYNQLSKALLALEESMLIANNDYHPSYIEKVKRVKKYCSHRLLKYFEWATSQKLKPQFIWNFDLLSFYFNVKDIFLEEMKRIINKCYRKNFRTWDEYAHWYLKRLDVQWQFFLHALWQRNFSYSKVIKVKLAQILLTAALNKYFIDRQLTEKACDLLNIKKKDNNHENIEEIWWKLREITLNLQQLYES
jgi:hypothetical protein